MRNGNTEARLRRRGLTTMVLALFFSIMGLTGLVLYAAPRGRVANWTNWNVLGLSKHDWAAIHITAGTLILAVVVIHLFLNWKVFAFYFKSSKPKNLNLRREMIVAASVAILFVGGTVANIPPFSTVLWANEWLKDYWEQTSETVPVAHAEELTIEDLSENIGLPSDEILLKIEEAGFHVTDPTAQFGEIAELNGVPPNALFEVVSPRSAWRRGNGRGGRGQTGYGGSCESDSPPRKLEGNGLAGRDDQDRHLPDGSDSFKGGGSGRGFGRMTIKEACLSEGLDLNQALAALRGQGVDISEDQTMREIGDRLGVHPRDVTDLVVPGDASE